MNQPVYFAGGYYYPTKAVKDKRGETHKIALTDQPRRFRLVSRSGGDDEMPYLTHKSDGLKLTSHHANLYGLTDDGRIAILIECRCPQATMFASAEDGFLYEEPVELSDAHIAAIKKAIEANYFFD